LPIKSCTLQLISHLVRINKTRLNKTRSKDSKKKKIEIKRLNSVLLEVKISFRSFSKKTVSIMYNVEEGEITAQETRNREAFKEGKPLFFAHPTDTGFKLAAACTNKNHK
jgi:ABC-type polar amino acid transport system ATPase subunit